MAHWADSDLELARQRGLLRGDWEGQMRPEDPLKRGEAATVLNRLWDQTKESFYHLLPTVERAIVMITNEDEEGHPRSLGSGTSIGGGLVLTNAHVVLNADGTTDLLYGITWDAWGYGQSGQARYAMAELVHLAQDLDLAVLRVGIAERGDMPVLSLGDPAQIRKAAPVAVLGSPVGLIGSVSVGIVSYLGRKMAYDFGGGKKVAIPDMVQTDAAINPGNSGGALVNLAGELIGVPSVKLSALALEGLGFCIGLTTIRETLDRAGIHLTPRPNFVRPNYERYGWGITPAKHTMQKPVRYLVVHHEGSKTVEGSNALAIHREQIGRVVEPFAAIGYHACAERDGAAIEGRPLWSMGAHARDYNEESLGLCLPGNLDMAPVPGDQLEAATAILRWWKLLYPRAEVAGHNELPGMTTSCPGRYLDMNALRAQVERR